MSQPVNRNLLQFVNKQRTLTDASRQKIFNRDNNTCQYCLSPADCIDHIIPYSHSPVNSPYNLVAACMTCNLIAGNQIFDDFAHKRLFILTKLCKICSRSTIKIWTIDEIKELRGKLRKYVEDNTIVVPSENERQHVLHSLQKHKYHYQDTLTEILGLSE